MWFLVEKPLWEHQHSWDYFFKSGTLKSNIVLNVIWSKLVQYEAWSKAICQIDVLYTVKECRNSNLFKLRYVFVNLLLKRLEKMTKDVDKSDKCFQSWRYYRDLHAASCAKLCCSSVADFFFFQVMFCFSRLLAVSVQVLHAIFKRMVWENRVRSWQWYCPNVIIIIAYHLTVFVFLFCYTVQVFYSVCKCPWRADIKLHSGWIEIKDNQSIQGYKCTVKHVLLTFPTTLRSPLLECYRLKLCPSRGQRGEKKPLFNVWPSPLISPLQDARGCCTSWQAWCPALSS